MCFIRNEQENNFVPLFQKLLLIKYDFFYLWSISEWEF